MKRFVSMLTAGLAILSMNLSISAEISQEPLKPGDIFDLEFASYPQVSPDGQKILYMRRSFDVMRDATRVSLWLFDLTTDRHRPLIADFGSYGWPTWNHQGTAIAFVTRERRRHQIQILELTSTRTAMVVDLATAPSWLAWSPDDRQIAFIRAEAGSDSSTLYQAPKKPKGAKWASPAKVIDSVRYQFDGRGIVAPDFRHVFVVPSEGGTPTQLTQGDFQHQGPLVWNTNAGLIFSANRSENWALETFAEDLWQVSVNDGTMVSLTNDAGSEFAPALSADGNLLLFLSASGEQATYRPTTLWLLDRVSGERFQLGADLDVSIESAVFTRRDRSVAVMFDQRGKRVLAEISLSDKVSTLADNIGGTNVGRPYTSGSFDYANGTYAFTLGRADRPAELAVLEKGQLRQLTALNEDVLGRRALGQVEEFVYLSQFDQTPIHGFYVLPPDFDPSQKYPLILEIHGGPHLAYGKHFSAELQLMAAAGYVVFYDNYRGSTSYGEGFALRLKDRYASEEDFADHMSGIDHMIQQGFIDERNLFIAGGSAGGIGTAYAVGLTNRFNAAVAVKPVVNWISKTLTADSYIFQINHQFPGPPWEEFEAYWKRSPLSLVGQMTTPIMLITGEQDRRTPISETEQLYQALKFKGVESVMVRLPGSAHGISGRPSRLLSKVGHTLAWFERFRVSSKGADSEGTPAQPK